jgi:hypothetical protein
MEDVRLLCGWPQDLAQQELRILPEQVCTHDGMAAQVQTQGRPRGRHYCGIHCCHYAHSTG